MHLAACVWGTESGEAGSAWHAAVPRQCNQPAPHPVEPGDPTAERAATSRWIHLEFGPYGFPSLATITPPQDPACPLCRHTGEADDGLGAVRDIVAGLEGPEMG